MNCIKCGTKIPAEQVFCEECLADMERHPVKPDTPVLLPPRDSHAPTKRSSHRRSLKPEEQISLLRRTVTWLLVVVMVLIIGLTVSVMLLLKMIDGRDVPFLPGQNYGTSSTPFSSGEE